MKKNAFCFILEAVFILKINKFLHWLFGNVELTAWDKVNFKIHDLTTWLTTYENTDIAQHLPK